MQQILVTTFDEWALQNRLDRLDVVKIDVEGAEMLVLEGMRGSLERLRPRALVVEIKGQVLVSRRSSVFHVEAWPRSHLSWSQPCAHPMSYSDTRRAQRLPMRPLVRVWCCMTTPDAHRASPRPIQCNEDFSDATLERAGVEEGALRRPLWSCGYVTTMRVMYRNELFRPW